MSSQIHQLALLPAGCQPWNGETVATCGHRFAYCSTQAIYIYEYSRERSDFVLSSVMSEHQKTITSVAWHPTKDELLASTSVDGHVVVWDVERQKVVAELRHGAPANLQPRSVAWCPKSPGSLSFLNGRGPLMTWRYAGGDVKAAVSVVKETQSVSNGDVSRFRWHPGLAGQVIFGHSDGTVSLVRPGQKPQRHFPLGEENRQNDPVLGLEWDPLSAAGGGDSSCLLAASPAAGLCMLSGGARLEVLMRFAMPSAAAELQALAWIPSAPGLFVTGDANLGLLRLFNVSRPQALEVFRLKKSGFRGIQVFTDPLPARSLDKKLPFGNGDSPDPRADAVAGTGVVVPPAHVVCTFLDGGVGVYNLQRARWAFLRDQGHIETIFDCQFQPEDVNRLATGSFDGSIKVWDVRDMSAVVSSPGNEGIIYALSWCPHPGPRAHLLAAASSKNGVLIYDAHKSVFAKRFQEHKSAVFSVSWSPIAEDFIASGSSDSTCLVRNLNGKLLATLAHPRGVFGVEWSPFHKNMLVTGCEDSVVRIFDISTGQAVQQLKGHSAKVFQVRFSPLKEDLLCSSSDDRTVRVWNATTGVCRCALQGHAAPVRGLAWHCELPFLLASGSWDATVRLWDVRDGACVETVLDHGADVYGLTWHRERPFLLATSSRDSTLRLWSVDSMAQAASLVPLAPELLEQFVGCTPAEHGLAAGSITRLFGRFSGELRAARQRQGNESFRMLQLLQASPHLENLWNLVDCLQGVDEGFLRESYPKGIVHRRHMLKYRRAQALEMEVALGSRLGPGGVHSLPREERAKTAAQLHLVSGDLRRHCDLLVQAGRWERALALAPGVSLAYWSELSSRHAAQLAERGAQEGVAPLLATGRVEEAVRLLQLWGQQEEALCVAQAGAEGCFSTSQGAPTLPSNGGGTVSGLVEEVALEAAEQLLTNGCPLLAACRHLAIGDKAGSVSKLIRGNELVLAAWLARRFQLQPLTDFAISCLLRRSDKMAGRQFAVSLSRSCRPDAREFALLCLCARQDGGASEIDALHHTAGLPLMAQCAEKARQLEARDDPEAVEERVKWLLLSPKPEAALEPGLVEAKRRMSTSNWRACDVVRLLWSLCNLRPSRLQRPSSAPLLAQLFALSCLLGASLAAARRFFPVVAPLLQKALDVMEQHALEDQLPVAADDIKEDLEALTKFSRDGVRLEGGVAARWRRLVERGACGGLAFPPDLEAGALIGSGSNLPAHADVNTSHFSGRRVRGSVFFLNDGRTTISLNEALMWAHVNPLSPSGSGGLINPF